MSDLVERLRGLYPVGKGDPPEFGMRQFPTNTIQLEAADELERFAARVEELEKGLKAVEQLIAESGGVYGLHLNGDMAPWAELRSGGRFEEWLRDFDAAIDAAREGE